MAEASVLKTRKQIAAAFGVDIATVQRWKRRGMLKVEQPGGPRGTWLMPAEALKKSGEG